MASFSSLAARKATFLLALILICSPVAGLTTGMVRPPLPAHLADLFEREERFTRLPNDLAAVQEFVATTFR